jgi:hypothetical protein
MKHKHAELIIAWANGAQIQAKTHKLEWEDRENPLWDTDSEYRIKPEPKPDWTKLVLIETYNLHICRWDEDHHNPNLRLTFDGETGKLKSTEVI